jgi:hypothetical protein
MSENIELQAQGVFDLIKLADKDLIEKILAISKTITVQQLENGITRISIDVVTKS